MKAFLLGSVVAAATLASSASVSRASFYWNSYWNLDARIRFVPVQQSYTIPTGYWNAPFAYNYGAGLYTPFMGSYHGFGSYYPFYSPYYNWYSQPYVYGFVDSLRATWTGLVPVTTYWHSWYWDPEGTGRTLDVITSGDDLGSLSGLPTEFQADFTQNDHTFEVHSSGAPGPYSSGTFSGVSYLTISQLAGYVGGLPDMTPTAYGEFINSSLYQKMLVDLGPDGVVGVTLSSGWRFNVPEPSLLAPIGFAGFAMARRRRDFR